MNEKELEIEHLHYGTVKRKANERKEAISTKKGGNDLKVTAERYERNRSPARHLVLFAVVT